MEKLVEFFNSPIVLFVLNLAVLFIVKVIDNILGTSKTILVQKNKGAIAVASGVGTYLAVKLNDKFSKERTFVNVILSDNREAMEELREYLREHKITNLATEAFTKEWDKTIAITAYAETKEESRLLDAYIANSEIKFKRVITKN